MEAEELQCHKDVAAFFNSVATSAETLIVSELLSRTRKSKLYKDNSSDGAAMRRALRKENVLKAKMARGWRSITHTAEDLATRRAELDSYQGIIRQAELETKTRADRQEKPQGKHDERTVRNTLKVLIALNPTADPKDLEMKIRETMKSV